MAELLTLLQLLAPGLLAGLLDRSRSRALARASLLVGMAVAAPALADLLRAPFADVRSPSQIALLPTAWAAQAAAVGLCLAMPTLVRLGREMRARAGLARMARERAGIAAEWGD